MFEAIHPNLGAKSTTRCPKPSPIESYWGTLFSLCWRKLKRPNTIWHSKNSARLPDELTTASTSPSDSQSAQQSSKNNSASNPHGTSTTPRPDPPNQDLRDPWPASEANNRHGEGNLLQKVQPDVEKDEGQFDPKSAYEQTDRDPDLKYHHSAQDRAKAVTHRLSPHIRKPWSELSGLQEQWPLVSITHRIGLLHDWKI